MTANIEINTARDPAIELMATVFAKPDLYFVAGNAGFKLRHLRHLPSRCREIMQRYAEALDRTDNWEAVVDVFRQRDPGFFRWLNARAAPVDAERINELVAEVTAAANGSFNGTTGPLSNGGSVGTAYTSSDKPLPSELTRWTTLTYVDATGAMCTTMASDNAKIEHFPGIRRIDPETGLAEPEPPAASSGAKSQSKPRDINDFHVEHGADAVRDVFDKAVTEDPASTRSSPRLDESGTIPNKRNAAAIAAALAGIKTATTLQTMTFPLLKYIVPGLIVEGCVLLAGKPKAGKSWFSYDVALAVASGRFCLGDKKCEEGDVLYLALEDNDRRLQSRATKLLPTFAGIWPERFNFQTHWPRANEGGIEAIDQWCEAHPGARLVVIDVLAAFRAPSTNKTNAYDQDYAAVSQLQKLAARRAITIIIVHHTRKGVSEDPVEEISGT